jgi:RNA polymerase sigma factor (sigma-70 family)
LSDLLEKTSAWGTEDDLSSKLELQGLYCEYYAPLVRFFSRKLPNDDDPEDMVQQVFFQIVEAAKHTKFTFSRNFIFIVARNALIDRLRWRKSHRVNDHDLAEENLITSQAALPDRILQGKQELDGFLDELDKLPLRCKQVFLLYRVYNMQQKDIAAHLGLSLSTVQKHMMNAMRKLQDTFKKMEES